MSLLPPWVKYLAVLIIAALLVGAGWRLGGASGAKELAELRANHAELNRIAAVARAAEVEQAREREHAWRHRAELNAEEGEINAKIARDDADAARVAERRVLDQLTSTRAALGRATAAARAAAAGKAAEADPGRVPTDLLELLDQATQRYIRLAGIYAAEADARGAAGATCERHDALTQEP